MARAQQEKKKNPVGDAINEILASLERSRRGGERGYLDPAFIAKFSPSDIKEYEQVGLTARQKRDELAQATPKRVERMVLHRQMNEGAFRAAIDLATLLENAAAEGRKPELKGWTKA